MEALKIDGVDGAEYTLQDGETFVWITVGKYSLRIGVTPPNTMLGSAGVIVTIYHEGGESDPPIDTAKTGL